MQRIAPTTIACLFLVLVSGCAWLGLGKKNTAADVYDPATDPAAQQYAAVPYPSLPVDSGTAAASGGSRYHTVQKKDTLYAIARQYYGDHTRWKDIYQANRGEIGDPNKIRVGQRLMIP